MWDFNDDLNWNHESDYQIGYKVHEYRDFHVILPWYSVTLVKYCKSFTEATLPVRCLLVLIMIWNQHLRLYCLPIVCHSQCLFVVLMNLKYYSCIKPHHEKCYLHLQVYSVSSGSYYFERERSMCFMDNLNWSEFLVNWNIFDAVVQRISSYILHHVRVMDWLPYVTYSEVFRH